jgi:hypothetical protein
MCCKKTPAQCECVSKKKPTRVDNGLLSNVLIFIFIYCLEFAAFDVIHISTIFVKVGNLQYHVPYPSMFLANLQYPKPAGMTNF